jgi:hypothetical protein
LPDVDKNRDAFLFGQLGRSLLIEENLPPEEGFGEATHPGWKTCVIVVDPTDHSDGQKASVQINKKIGDPSSIFSHLVQTINTDESNSAFELEAQPILNAGSFWEFAEENKGAVTSLTFEFVVPNGLWSADTDLRNELGQLRRSIKAKMVTNKFQSEDGLDTDDPIVREAVEYAASGSGAIRAKAKGKKKFNSKTVPKTVTLGQNTVDNESLIARIVRVASEVLGR